MNRPLLFLLSISMTGCFSIAHQDFYVKQPVPLGKTIQVVHANPGNLIHGLLEQALVQEGWNVLSGNLIHNQYPTALSTTVSTRDTTYTTPVYNHHVFELFEEKPADYILKYQYSIGTTATRLWRLNATIIDRSTGEIINTFTFRNSGWKAPLSEKVIARMVEALDLKNPE